MTDDGVDHGKALHELVAAVPKRGLTRAEWSRPRIYVAAERNNSRHHVSRQSDARYGLKSIHNIADLNMNLLPVLERCCPRGACARARASGCRSRRSATRWRSCARCSAIRCWCGARAGWCRRRRAGLAAPLRAALASPNHGTGPVPFDPARRNGASRSSPTTSSRSRCCPSCWRGWSTRRRRRRAQRPERDHVPGDLERGQGNLLGVLRQHLREPRPLSLRIVRRGHARVRGQAFAGDLSQLPHVLVSHQPDGRGSSTIAPAS